MEVSTQMEGVKSDIVMPDRYAYIDMGERDNDNAMPWDKIDPAKYKRYNNNFAPVIANSKKRMAANAQFKLMDENAKWVNQQKDESTYSLNYDKFMVDMKKDEAMTKKFKALNDYKNNLEFKALPYEQEIFKKDPALAEKKQRWYESLSKDIYVEEALNILDDMNGKPAAGSAANIKPKKDLVKTR
jgi:carboxyl-terminal processing protease